MFTRSTRPSSVHDAQEERTKSAHRTEKRQSVPVLTTSGEVDVTRADKFSAVGDAILIGPLYGLPPPKIDEAELDGRVQSVGLPSHSSQDHDRILSLETLALRALWNAQVPLHRLPVELLARTFDFAEEYNPRTSTTENRTIWIQLAAVCRHWRAVIFGHERFWNTVVVREHTEWLRLSLSRARNILLNLEFHHIPTLASVLSDVVPQCHRIRSLVVTRDVLQDLIALRTTPNALRRDAPDVLRWLADNQFPHLSKLSITYLPHNLAGKISITSDNFPRLTKLQLTRLLVQWCPSLLSHITELNLCDCGISNPRLPADTFFDILARAQRLEHLELRNIVSAACRVQDSCSKSRDLIVLPRLHTLLVTDTLKWIREFTNAVQLPLTGHVFLCGRCQAGDFRGTPVSVRTLLSRQEDRLRAVPDRDNGRLSAVSRLLEPLSLSMDRCVHLKLELTNVPNFSQDDVFTSIADVVGFAALTHIHLYLNILQVTRPTLDTFLDSVPSLVELRLFEVLPPPWEPATLPPSDFCQALSGCMTVYGQWGCRTRTVRCPNLQSLSLGPFEWNDGALVDTLLNCLRVRKNREAQPLKVLELSVRWRGEFGLALRAREYCMPLQKMASADFSVKFVDRGHRTIL
ncbi:hypothetical protein C8Q77DRAFT_1126719 [Trametes polyzona]|nr:hypothetical protein C8Q77DRAFT_1126719 [Trametes polyzona]